MDEPIRRRWNMPIWAGLLIVVAVAAAYVPVVERFPALGNLAWPAMLLLLAALVLIGMGLVRAYREPRHYRGRIAGPVVMLLGVASTALFAASIYLARQIPEAAGAPRAGEKAPDFTLPDTEGRQIALADLLAGDGGSGGVVLIFYRGYW